MRADDSLLLLGASTRAVAFSALRAGLQPWCADLFGDADLQAQCSVTVLSAAQYPEGFLSWLEQAPPGPWMYTGGLENHPALVRRLARGRPLWGNDASVLAIARSPRRVRAILQAGGISCPEVHLHADLLSAQRRWLVKPRRGAGGIGIQFFHGASSKGHARKPVYFQEYLEGEPCAALYVGDGRTARLLGVTYQLIGESWLHAAAFHYCGSIGPLPLTPALEQAFGRLGEALAQGCQLRGLFGVDCVLREEVPWPVEVNPRYTASVEILEYAQGEPALRWHHQVFDPRALAPPPCVLPPSIPLIGKAILFARAPLCFPAEGPWRTTLHLPPPLTEPPEFADIPHAGERIAAGRPILTFFVRAASPPACRAALRQTAADLDQRLFGR
jgi:predicted ATP-grasp superfamily ATP-dependent carboligase